MELFNNDPIQQKTVEQILSQEAVVDTGSTGISSGGRQVGGIIERAAYYSNIDGARVEIFPEDDETIGFVTYNAASTVVFKTIIGGTNVGDVVIGDYDGGKGMLWDQSATTFTVKGDIVGSTITGGTLQTSAATDVNRIKIVGANNDIEFWNEDNELSGTIETFYTASPAPTSGISIAGGAGTYISLSGRAATGFSILGASDGSNNDGAIAVTWSGSDYSTIRLSLASTIGGVSADLPIEADLIPYSDSVYYLGNASYRWADVYSANYNLETVGSDLDDLVGSVSDLAGVVSTILSTCC